MPENSAALLWTLSAVCAALLGGTLVRIVALRGAATSILESRLSSLRTWWILFGSGTIAVMSGRIGTAMLLATAGALALREFVGLVGWSNVGRPTAILVFAFVPLYYIVAIAGQHELVRQLAPAAFFVALGGLRSWLGLIEGYIRTTAAVFWGLMLFVYGLSHAYFLLELPSTVDPPVGHCGHFLFLILLTETNDIMQALVGRRFGKHKITPRISPNKSLEGLLGGMLITTLLAVLTASTLTIWSVGRSPGQSLMISALAGLLISLLGFLGDINMSGIKRDVGVKDGSTLLPGHGGMIDRIDSLTFTAPVFYYFVRGVTG
ncbi:MAG: phosphatidate cytidylyltransferase [Planctomycetales bacterium]|jgi:phosphatidate cytidylyltransferase|nr:phosphatidate cytidylyltransferase [Planctomycetales bacterium]